MAAFDNRPMLRGQEDGLEAVIEGVAAVSSASVDV